MPVQNNGLAIVDGVNTTMGTFNTFVDTCKRVTSMLRKNRVVSDAQMRILENQAAAAITCAKANSQYRVLKELTDLSIDAIRYARGVAKNPEELNVALKFAYTFSDSLEKELKNFLSHRLE